MWGLEDRVKGCRTVKWILGHYMSEEGGYPRRRGKRFLGALGGKDWLKKENHEEWGKFPTRSSLLPPH